MQGLELIFDFSFLFEDGVIGMFLNGVMITLLVALFGLIIGIFLGGIIGLVKLLGPKPLQVLASIYTTYFRATPLLVQLYIIYYLPSMIFNVNVNSFVAGVIAIGLNSAAYVAEIFRGGVLSVDKGQFEAGRSLGFSQNQTLTKIIIPQAIKNILP
ncbi:MAG: amino acid ABC transporter permease, partial [Bacilli bacterium]